MNSNIKIGDLVQWEIDGAYGIVTKVEEKNFCVNWIDMLCGVWYPKKDHSGVLDVSKRNK